MRERYSIEVTDESVLIYGQLSIEETFDFLNFYEKKGFNRIDLGHENSSISMYKDDIKLFEEKVKKSSIETSEKFYENLYADLKLKHDELLNKIEKFEDQKEDLSITWYKKYQEIYGELIELRRTQYVSKMEQNPIVKEIIDRFDIDTGCDPTGRVPVDLLGYAQPLSHIVPCCCSTPEKQEAFEKLLKLKKDFSNIPIADYLSYLKTQDNTEDKV